jgi:hypothetical protein
MARYLPHIKETLGESVPMALAQFKHLEKLFEADNLYKPKYLNFIDNMRSDDQV